MSVAEKRRESPKFFAELQRRNVYRVAVAYGVVSWLLIQIATQVFPFFDIPNWTIRMVVIVLVLGFPVAAVLAWAFEFTPEGLVRTDEVDVRKSIVRRTGRKLDFVIIGVLLAVIAVLAFQHYRPPRLPEKSIAVIPFVDLSQEKDQEYFSDGISEQIINSLSKIHGLFVVARTSSFVFKNKYEDIREVGRLLHVMHVLEGSVSRGAGKVRVDTRLIDVTNGYQLWSETYNSSDQDFMSLQNDLAQKVASALQVELHLAESKQLAKPPTYDPEAYDLYLRGRYFLNKRTVESIQKARSLFEQAVVKDARFALGHAGIADSFILLGEYGAISAAEASRQAWPQVSSALAIDDNLPEGHISRAMLLTDFEWNWPEAASDYQKAIAVNPNSATAHHWYALHLAELGRVDDALREIALAEKQDPLAPIIRAAKGKILCMAHRFDQAIEQSRKALDLEANFAPAFSILAQAHSFQKQHSEAIAAAKKYVELSGGDPGAKLELAYAHAAAGHQADAEAIVREATAQPGKFSPYDMATIRAASHDTAGALQWLETAIEQRSIDAVWIRVDPRLDNIRDDPRFAELLSRMRSRR